MLNFEQYLTNPNLFCTETLGCLLWRKHRRLFSKWRPSASRRKQKKRKEGRKEGRKEEKHPNSGKLAIRPDHPRHQTKMKLCMVGDPPCVVILFKCDPNRSRGDGAMGVENGPSLLLWLMTYTTACTTVQAVINSLIFAVLMQRLTQM